MVKIESEKIFKIIIFFLIFIVVQNFLVRQYQELHFEAFSLPYFRSYLMLNFITGVDKLPGTNIKYSQYEGIFEIYMPFQTKAKSNAIYFDPPHIVNFCNVTIIGPTKDYKNTSVLYNEIITNSTSIKIPVKYSKRIEKDFTFNALCPLNQSINPNGILTLSVYNRALGDAKHEKVWFHFIFNDYEYGCREFCLMSRDLTLTDDDIRKDLHYLTLESENITLTTSHITFRTFSKIKELQSNYYYAIFIGVILIVLEALFTERIKKFLEV